VFSVKEKFFGIFFTTLPQKILLSKQGIPIHKENPSKKPHMFGF
jgi:hypothetical protein